MVTCHNVDHNQAIRKEWLSMSNILLALVLGATAIGAAPAQTGIVAVGDCHWSRTTVVCHLGASNGASEAYDTCPYGVFEWRRGATGPVLSSGCTSYARGVAGWPPG